MSEDPIRPEELLNAGSTAEGAVSLFVGRVRDHNAGRQVKRLHYEAYDEMAERELLGILSEAAGRWEVGEVAAVHRIGSLELGETSLAVLVTAPHRATACEASRHIVEEIKRRLPVWKKEEYVDGQEEWVRPSSSEA